MDDLMDLAALFALGEGLARQAITTAGTTIRVETRVTDTTPGTLEKTTTATPKWEGPGIVTAAGNVNATSDLLPGVELRRGDWKITLTPDTPTPNPGDWVVVTVSRDPHLPGTDAQVLGHLNTSAGAVLTVYARPGGV